MRDLSRRGFAVLLLAWVCAGVTPGQDIKRGSPLEIAIKLSAQLDRDSQDYEESHRSLAGSYWAQGMHDRALESAERLESRERLELLCYFSRDAIKQGKQEIAKQALTAASKILSSQPEYERNARIVTSLISDALELGESNSATNLLVFLDEETPSRADALLSMAEACQKQGDTKGALALLSDSLKQLEPVEGENSFYFITNLNRALRLLAANNQKEHALQLIHRANLISQDDDLNRGRYQEKIASAYGEIGEFAQSQALAESYDSETKALSLIILASKYGAAGRKADALSTLSRVRELAESKEEDNWSTASLLNKVISVYLTLGEGDTAMDLVRQVDDPYYLRISASEVADWFLKKGSRDGAVAALDFASASLRRLVSEKSEDIRVEASGSIAKTKSMLLTELGTKFIENGEFERALTAANSIDQPQYRAILLANVALAQARAGYSMVAGAILEEAQKIATTSPSYRHDRSGEDALLRIAEAYASMGLKREAIRTLSGFLALVKDADWKPLPDLVRLGVLCETYDLQLNRDGQAKMKRIVRQWKEDN